MPSGISPFSREYQIPSRCIYNMQWYQKIVYLIKYQRVTYMWLMAGVYLESYIKCVLGLFDENRVKYLLIIPPFNFAHEKNEITVQKYWGRI